MVMGSNIQQLFSLENQVALITGARHLGYYAARTLLELGAAVVVTTRNQETAERLAESLIAETGGCAIGLCLEATLETSWQDLVGTVVKRLGKINILVNNAGGRDPEIVSPDVDDSMDSGFLEERPLQSWQRTMDKNLNSAFLGCKTVAPYFKAQHQGKIVNIASIDGIVGRDLRLYRGTGLSPTVPDYQASKAAVIGLTKSLAVNLARFNVHVNCISPGGFFRNQPTAFVEKYSSHVPMNRMGRDDTDLNGAIAFLCSAASDYVTGHNLVIDGGWTAW